MATMISSLVWSWHIGEYINSSEDKKKFFKLFGFGVIWALHRVALLR